MLTSKEIKESTFKVGDKVYFNYSNYSNKKKRSTGVIVEITKNSGSNASGYYKYMYSVQWDGYLSTNHFVCAPLEVFKDGLDKLEDVL